MSISFPHLGHGVGLRPKHYLEALDDPRVDWFEVISENFMVPGGRPLEMLRRAREARPIVLHGVSMSLGTVDPLRDEYLTDLAALAARFEPAWISDHLCWGSHQGRYAHDLLPLPYTEEALAHVAQRIRRVQDRLGRQILIENVSSYVTFADTAMPEWEFLAAVAEAADCGILLDVNNIYVSGVNHGFDPYAYVDAVPAARVGQFHLAGHTVHETHLLDTHDHPVCDEVWALYAHAVRRFGRISTLVEWDDLIPSYGELVAESERARAAERGALAEADAVTS
jgi:uncharacterized protein (UPF0276 family)